MYFNLVAESGENPAPGHDFHSVDAAVREVISSRVAGTFYVMSGQVRVITFTVNSILDLD